ncbi:AAA family ATPase [Candidatus Venteria ishoeyi]|uniref:ATP-dependent nuclease n=1 Tax=Candidatus Venteria ishoeyi TaxID=1899563 RepID=UPI0025A4DB61|nr:AAA family ATPase [Candidatus Venteria ishoeyi]MDM8546183.1 AAA family ATPase [Candidatus Venteria ishoeyi]
MSIFIEKTRIRNFRSLRQVDITLSPNVTLLVGANNAGKTTFLRALGIALNADRRFISQDDLFIDKDGNALGEDERAIWIDVKIVPADGRSEFDDLWLDAFGVDAKIDASGQQFFAFRTQIEFGVLNKQAQIKRYVINTWESNSADENSEVSANLSGIPFHFIDAQRDLNEDVHQRTSHFGSLTGKIEYDQAQRRALENALAQLNEDAVARSAVLLHLRTSLAELNKTVQERGRGVEITPFPKKVRDLHKGMKVHFQDGGSDTFSLEYHGMGTRSWASLLAFKAKVSWDSAEKQEENEPFFPILGLEEPEAHLHPNAQRQVYRQLAEISGQKIISTHSPYIAALADLSEIRHFYKASDITVLNRIDTAALNTDERRKLKREVLQSNGELLFSKAIILFEGETESQALPIFAKKYWNMDPFEMGLTFIAVNGNNYKPFLLLASAFNVPWFIFSDYDKTGIKRGVDNALSDIGLDSAMPHSNAVKLNMSIEDYLISESYQSQLKAGINAWYAVTTAPDTDQRQIDAGVTKINSYTDEKLLRDISSDNGKVRYPSFWAKEIIKLSDDRAIPPKIRDLFNAISTTTLHPIQEQISNDAI